MPFVEKISPVEPKISGYGGGNIVILRSNWDGDHESVVGFYQYYCDQVTVTTITATLPQLKYTPSAR